MWASSVRMFSSAVTSTAPGRRTGPVQPDRRRTSTPALRGPGNRGSGGPGCCSSRQQPPRQAGSGRPARAGPRGPETTRRQPGQSAGPAGTKKHAIASWVTSVRFHDSYLTIHRQTGGPFRQVQHHAGYLFLNRHVAPRITRDHQNNLIVDQQRGTPRHAQRRVVDNVTRNRLCPILRHQAGPQINLLDRKSTRLNSSHVAISYAVFCLKKKTKDKIRESNTIQSILRNQP